MNGSTRTIAGRPLISLVIPVFNEEPNIDRLYAEINRVADSLRDVYRFEFLFTDNRSVDRTFEKLAELSQDDRRIRVIRFSRNFGFQRSILTGYLNARGDAAIQLDADLQDPPALIPDMLEKWRAGYDVVYGVRRRRKENPILSWMRDVFYAMIDTISETGSPRGAGDFRLISRRVLDVLHSFKGSTPYIRGTISEIGFAQIGIPYDRDERRAGQSKFKLKKLISFAADAIVHQSTLPLRLSAYIAGMIAVLSLCGILAYAALYIARGETWPTGFATLALLILLSTFMNACFFAILGAYIGQIHQSGKGLPISIPDQVIDHPSDESEPTRDYLSQPPLRD